LDNPDHVIGMVCVISCHFCSHIQHLPPSCMVLQTISLCSSNWRLKKSQSLTHLSFTKTKPKSELSMKYLALSTEWYALCYLDCRFCSTDSRFLFYCFISFLAHG
jgi:hypothetical protein